MATKLKIEKRGSYVKLSSAVAARSEIPDTMLEGDHPRIISAKFG
jgi:hypothetical protein